MRKYAREVVFSRIYEFLLNPQQPAELDFGQFEEKNLNDDDRNYINEVFGGVKANFSEYTDTVTELSSNFRIERIYKTDLSILALAMYEISRTDTPDNVCINEAVELAKKFSSDKSAGFVNGLLAEYIKKQKSNEV